MQLQQVNGSFYNVCIYVCKWLNFSITDIYLIDLFAQQLNSWQIFPHSTMSCNLLIFFFFSLLQIKLKSPQMLTYTPSMQIKVRCLVLQLCRPDLAGKQKRVSILCLFLNLLLEISLLCDRQSSWNVQRSTAGLFSTSSFLYQVNSKLKCAQCNSTLGDLQGFYY